MTTPFESYLATIEAIYRHGNATEHTYRATLGALLEALAPGVRASNDPKHIACGAPDFIVERGSVPLGYAETKDIDVDLDKIAKSDQLKHYRASLHNLILTDYLEFRWYVHGKEKLSARLASIGKGGKLVPDAAGLASAAGLFQEFYRTEVPTVGTPKELAERMAQLARLVRDLIVTALQAEDAARGALHRQYDAFRQHLLPALKPEEFADLYIQTMAYGLFAARLNAPPDAPFSRNAAYQYLASNRFLRKLFLDVGEELDDTPIAPFLDDIASLLAHADMAAILQDFGRRTRTEDPVVHFYETFLAQYDPRLREGRGVYYTPEPVVQFIVRSVDWLLKERFARPWGLADGEVRLLDPATGTGTFLYYALRTIHETLLAHGQGGAWRDYVHEKLLPRLYGFELLMAPYVIAHLKLGLLLKDLGYETTKDDRLRVYLTNTLDEGVTRTETLGSLGWYITQEANDAAEVKKDAPIMVVLGNPPYSYESENKGKWITSLVRDYYQVDGQPLGERNPKGLQDDYIKFIRFAQWRIQQTGYGILAFITNHGYLNNPTFRGMRRNLMKTFDELYVLDLHGNAKRKERAPDGGKDENVFDIQQGVAILLAVKRPNQSAKPAEPVRVCHAHLYGLRERKYNFLASHDVSMTEWMPLQPTAPFYLFVPQDVNAREEYERGWKITEIMPTNSTGIVTARDHLTVHMSAQEAKATLSQFVALPPESARQQFALGEDSRDWQVVLAQNDLRQTQLDSKYLVRMLYRPFDVRFTYYTGHSRGFHSMPRQAVMRHLMQPGNTALLVTRQVSIGSFQHVFVSQNVVDRDPLSLATRERTQVFPIYLYTTSETTAGTLFAQSETTRAPNLAPAFIAACSQKLGLAFIPDGAGDLTHTFGPEDVFHYAYAVFHAPTYRARYAEFLKIDFPRLPLTADRGLFATLVAKGAELVGLHLMKSPRLDDLITTYPVQGNNAVDKVQYAAGRVWINATQYFGGVPEEVWTFRVGGYQVCDKWLKDRKGRLLSSAEIMHYQRVVVALKETLRLMEAIERAIPAWPMA